jgi:hypothetical protein
MSRIVRRLIVAIVTASALLFPATAALADPSFGAGGSDGAGNNSPNETPNQCHAPGQTNDLPQCR